MFVKALRSINELIGATSSACACYALYNTTEESEEETMKKVLIADAFIILASFAESLNKRNYLFSNIYDAKHSAFTYLSGCCSFIRNGITLVFANRTPK